jgi:hypothetical protein
MLTGNGDSSKLTEAELKTLTELRRMVETKHIVSLTPDQTELVLEMIDWFSQWKSVLRLANSIRNVALLLGGLLVIWWTTKENLAEWIRGVVQK